jgi:hypothetical protein
VHDSEEEVKKHHILVWGSVSLDGGSSDADKGEPRVVADGKMKRTSFQRYDGGYTGKARFEVPTGSFNSNLYHAEFVSWLHISWWDVPLRHERCSDSLPHQTAMSGLAGDIFLSLIINGIQHIKFNAINIFFYRFRFGYQFVIFREVGRPKSAKHL